MQEQHRTDIDRPGLGDRDLRRLAREVRERVIGPADPGWDQCRLGWNLAVEVRPAAVVEAADAADVAAAVRFAARHGMPVSPQPSGHGVTGALDGAIVLRTAALEHCTVDTGARVARVGAGVKWQRLNEALTGTGRTGLPGSTSDVSVLGYHLGGGLSWFARRHGLAAHRIRSVDVVDAAGERARISADSDPDLWWAVRGAGGDLVVGTGIELDLQPLVHLYAGRVVWPARDAAEVLEGFASYTAGPLPEELTVWAWLLNLPDVPDVPAPMRGRWSVALDCTYLGPSDDARALLDPLLRTLPPPALDTRGDLPLAALGGVAAEPVEPVPVHEDATLLARFGPAEVAAVLDAVDVTQPAPVAVIEVRHLGGAAARRMPGAGVAGSIPQPHALVCGGVGPTAETLEVARRRAAAIRAALGDADSGMSPPNFGPVRDRNLTAADHARLLRVKSRFDPAGVIRSSRPIAGT